MGSARPRPVGFSLVELLVVLAVLVLLTGMLLPAVASLRGSARRTLCAAHLREMALAATHYATLHRTWPPAIRYEQGDGGPRQISWDWEIDFSTGELLGPGVLWSHTDAPDEVLACPEYGGPPNFEQEPATGYNYNTSYVGAWACFPQFGWDALAPGVSPSRCRRTTGCALFGDAGRGGPTSTVNRWMRAPTAFNWRAEEGQDPPCYDQLQLSYAGGQSFRHHHATNVAWLDGHVSSQRAKYKGERHDEIAASHPELLGGQDPPWTWWPTSGYLSDDDRAYDPR